MREKLELIRQKEFGERRADAIVALNFIDIIESGKMTSGTIAAVRERLKKKLEQLGLPPEEADGIG